MLFFSLCFLCSVCACVFVSKFVCSPLSTPTPNPPGLLRRRPRARKPAGRRRWVLRPSASPSHDIEEFRVFFFCVSPAPWAVFTATDQADTAGVPPGEEKIDFPPKFKFVWARQKVTYFDWSMSEDGTDLLQVVFHGELRFVFFFFFWFYVEHAFPNYLCCKFREIE